MPEKMKEILQTTHKINPDDFQVMAEILADPKKNEE